MKGIEMWSAIAIVGIWFGVGLCSFRAAKFIGLVALCAMISTTFLDPALFLEAANSFMEGVK